MLKFIKHNLETIDGVDIYPIISLSIFFIVFVSFFIWAMTYSKDKIKEDLDKVEELVGLSSKLSKDNAIDWLKEIILNTEFKNDINFSFLIKWAKDNKIISNEIIDLLNKVRKKRNTVHINVLISTKTEISFNDLDDLFKYIRSKKAVRPISYWWYTPSIYNIDTVFTPSFIAPLSPYVQLWIPN